ncbi:hypothetical protein RE428_12980 [Marinobacter nanhaiticus D15-8W]|nr:hypothetical protein RE428_12980 [Marinobacter nanhaiticus D15-8W]
MDADAIMDRAYEIRTWPDNIRIWQTMCFPAKREGSHQTIKTGAYFPTGARFQQTGTQGLRPH